MRVPWGLALRHIRVHWFRNLLTVSAVTIAVFLFCFLVSMIVTLDSQVEDASRDRVIVQSAVSLFVALPLDYQAKIAAVPGVVDVSKWQWFGAYHKDRSAGYFTQFGVDPESFLGMYEDDFTVVEGPNGERPETARAAVARAMSQEKRAALVGRKLAEKFGWEVGRTVPLQSTIYPKSDDSAWEFVIVGLYEREKANFDDQTLFFRFDYLDDSLQNGTAIGPIGTGTYTVQVTEGADTGSVIADIDALFSNGPQRTKTSPEAAFQASFVSMLGNIPRFLGTIGGAVVIAVFFSVVNAMLISGRQRIRESGILKALGFRDRTIGTLILFESVLLTVLGGGFGILLALGAEQGVQKGMATFFPNFEVEPSTLLTGLGMAVTIGVIAGIAPMLNLVRLRPTEALRSEG